MLFRLQTAFAKQSSQLCPEVCSNNLFDIQNQVPKVSGYAEQSLHVIITRKWKITYQNYLLKCVRMCKHSILS